MTILLLLGIILAIVLVYERKLLWWERHYEELAAEHDQVALEALGYEAQLGAIRSYLAEEGFLS